MIKVLKSDDMLRHLILNHHGCFTLTKFRFIFKTSPLDKLTFQQRKAVPSMKRFPNHQQPLTLPSVKICTGMQFHKAGAQRY